LFRFTFDSVQFLKHEDNAVSPTSGQTPFGAPLGERLQTLRLRHGWNMDEVAAAAGISRTTLFHLERGEIERPRASTLHKLAQVFQVPVESFQRLAAGRTARLSAERIAGEPADGAGGVAPHDVARVAGNGGFRGEAGDTIARSGVAGGPLEARQVFDRLTNPVVTEVAADAPELFSGWSADDWDELYSQFATGGALREEGVRITAARINHDRETLYRLRVILQTHLADVAAGMVDTLYKLISVEPPVAGAADRPPGE
jgi:transcriptional regulator with XRE-family HTH domain